MAKSWQRAHFLGGLAASAALGTALPTRVRAAEAYVMRLSHPNPAAGLLGSTAVRFAVEVQRRSNGQLKVEVYPSGQLAQQQETVDGLANGVIDFSMLSTGLFVPLVPKLQVFDLPFLFKDPASAYRVADGPIGAEMAGDLDARGVLALGWGIGGFRQIQTTSKPIAVPEDMQGIRMRIQSGSGAIFVATYQALGATTITVDLAETYTALQQHTVDAVDLNLDLFTFGKYYTVVKHVAMTNHNLVYILLLGSKRKVEGLPANLQKVIKDAVRAVVPPWRVATDKQIAEDITILKSNGVSFTNIQLPAFRKVVEPVYTTFRSRPGGELIDRISRTVASR